jgi:hypothetical protein
VSGVESPKGEISIVSREPAPEPVNVTLENWQFSSSKEEVGRINYCPVFGVRAMKIRPFELLFHPPRTRPHPDSARAHIALSSWTVDKDQRILVSPECRTEREVREAVYYLKEDLDRVLAQARRRFAKAR